MVPKVPFNLKVPVGNRVYLEGHAGGTHWAFVGPQATLFDVEDGDDEQIITHFNSPNPEEDGKERPTWQSSDDTSSVWGDSTPPALQSSTDAKFVAVDAIPWLLLPKAGTQVGPTGGDTLTKTTFTQRLNTAGGIAPPADTCATAADAGEKALVPLQRRLFLLQAGRVASTSDRRRESEIGALKDVV